MSTEQNEDSHHGHEVVDQDSQQTQTTEDGDSSTTTTTTDDRREPSCQSHHRTKRSESSETGNRKRTRRSNYCDWLRKPPQSEAGQKLPQQYGLWLRQPAISSDSINLARTTKWRETTLSQKTSDSLQAAAVFDELLHDKPTGTPRINHRALLHDQERPGGAACAESTSTNNDVVNLARPNIVDDVTFSDMTGGNDVTVVESRTQNLSVCDADSDFSLSDSEDVQLHADRHCHHDEQSTISIISSSSQNNTDDAHDHDVDLDPHDHQVDEVADGQQEEPQEENEEDLESSDEEHEETADNVNGINDDTPIYKDARISYATHMLLIMAFVVRHGLSASAVLDLLTLIEIHCAAGNVCETSLRLFNKYFENGSSCERHYFCSHCGAYIGKMETACDKCRKTSLGSNYFLISPLSRTFQSFFERGDFLTSLRYRFTRTKQDANNIEDVYDGKLYNERFDADGYFVGTPPEAKEDEIHISLQMNTDGVSLFKSSKQSAWPVFFVINELHPKLRYSREFRILAGMWFSKQKPIFSTFMQPFGEILQALYTEGTKVHLPDGTTKTLKAVLLCVCCDSPARCLFQNFTQFNGKHGCPYCVEQGVSVKTSETGHTHTYPYLLETESGHGDPRSDRDTRQHALHAEETGTVVMGVKGKAPFFQVPMFDVIRCVPPDYMHGVMIGVFKLMVDLWFDVAHRCSKWSIRSKLKEVDTRLMTIKPPNFISRAPQSILTNVKWWKASEYRSFLLFYAIPCLYLILPTDYFEHLLLLINAMHILLGSSISKQSRTQARNMLKLFVLKIKVLYHPRYYTWNVHSLLHYVDFVEDHGPLFLFSCFWYEDFNGDLRNMFHGTRGVGFQVLTAIAISQKIPIMSHRLVYGTLEYELYHHMMRKSKFKRVHWNESISNSMSVVGILYPLDKKYVALVVRKIGLISNLLAFKRICFCNSIIQSKEYTRLSKRSNYTVRYRYEGSILIGNVVVYVKCYRKCPNIAFCHDNCICKNEVYVAIIESLVPQNICFHNKKSVSGCTLAHILPVESGKHVVIPVTDIVSQCILVDVGFRELFVTQLPNSHEKD